MNYDNQYVHDLESLLYFANKKVEQLSQPYTLTINEMEQEIRSLKELSGILKDIKEPIKIQLEPKTFGKRKK